MNSNFKIIGHRGAAGYERENTIASFYKAIEMGLSWVEFDIRLSSDGQPVVIHDANLSRVFGHNFRIDRLGASILGDLGVPSLDDVLVLLEKHQVGAYVEIKSCTQVGVDRVLARVKQDTAPRIISSFDHSFLRYIRACDGDVKVQPLFSSIPFNKPAYLDTLDPIEIGVSIAKLFSTSGRRLLKWGYPVLAYTVNEAHIVRRAQRYGVVGVFSDYPDLLTD